MPLDHSPRSLRRSMTMPPGISVPRVASGTRSPTAMLNAPQQIWSGLAVAGVDVHQLDAVGAGMRAQLEHPGHHDAVQAGAGVLDRLDGHAQVAQVLAQHHRVALDGSELAQPRQEDPHQN